MTRVVLAESEIRQRERAGRARGGFRSRPRVFYARTLWATITHFRELFMAGWEAHTDEVHLGDHRRVCPHLVLHGSRRPRPGEWVWCLDCGEMLDREAVLR